MSGKFQRSVRHFVMTLCCIGLFALSGCASFGNGGMAPAGTFATTISAVGHLGKMVGVPTFFVNGQWGGNNDGWGGGGGTICCVSMPYSPGKTTMVRVKWETCDISHIKFENNRSVDPNAHCTSEWHEATVPVHFEVPPGKGSGIKVHFLPEHRVEVWYTLMGPSGSKYPGPKYPRGPAPDYASLADFELSPEKGEK